MKSLIVIAGLITLSMFTFTGCIAVDNDFIETKSIVMNSIDKRFSKNIEFSVGSVGISLAKLIVKIDNTDPDAEAILDNISQVQVGIYERDDYGHDCDFSLFNDIDKKLQKENWFHIVKHVDGSELTGIYVHFNDEDIDKMYVINMDGSELHLIRVEGDLQNILEYAIREKGFNNLSFNE